MEQFVVYNTTTSDHTGNYVVRRFTVERGREKPDPEPLYVGKYLAAAREAIHGVAAGLFCLPRFTMDDPVIHEVWI